MAPRSITSSKSRIRAWAEVSAERVGDQLLLTVSDNGVGIGSGTAATAGSGTELKNIRVRLAASVAKPPSSA